MIAENRLWLGYNCGHFWFKVPDTYEEKATDFKIDENGQKWRRMGNICFFTNLDIEKRHEDMTLFRTYSPEAYPKYDNYDAVNVDKTADIPCDYYGVMGVPITFLDKYNPDQFEIVAFRKGSDGKDLVHSFPDCSQIVNVESREAANGTTVLPRAHSTTFYGQSSRDVNYTGALQFAESATAIPGMIKNAEGRITYVRLTIRRKQE
jgi:hypothetical protein